MSDRPPVAEPVTKKLQRQTTAKPHDGGRVGAAFLAAIGREVRRNRAKRGMTRRQLAQASETSERYLAQIESGAGNPSVSVLRAIAQALDLPASALLPETARAPPRSAPSSICWRRCRRGELPALAKEIEARVGAPDGADRARRIALVGLRGAGKSTLGRMLAQHLGWPFIELDRRVEEDYGASIPDLIEMAGTATFRRHERERARSRDRRARGRHHHHGRRHRRQSGNLCVASAPHPYGLDQGAARRAHEPRDGAGRFPPHGAEPRAMADLVAILEARRADYARAEAEVDTSGDAVEQSFAKLLRIGRRRWLGQSGRKP